MQCERPIHDLDTPVYPYAYNPSAWHQRLVICVLALVAAVISAYMSLFQWDLIDGVWDPVFGEQSEKVLKSDVAQRMFHVLGIHDAALGAYAYLGDAVLGFAGSTRRWQYRPWMVILFGIDVIPLGIVSAVLVMMQFAVVGYWCFLCLVTAAISLTLVYWAWDEVRVSLTYLYRVWKRHRRGRLLWRAFWGYRCPEAEQIAAEMVARRPS